MNKVIIGILALLLVASTTVPDTQNTNGECGTMPTSSVQDTDKINKDTKYKDGQLLNLLDTSDKSSVLLSNYSLDTALGMAMQGADGETLKEFESYYNMSLEEKTNRDKELLSFYANYDTEPDDFKTCLSVANGIFSDSAQPMLDSYINNLKTNYNALAEVLELRNKPEASAARINGWVAEQTRDKIKEIAPVETVADSDTILVNTVYFNGKWSEEYEDYQVQDEIFKNYDGTESTVKGMHSTESVYYENDSAIAFAKPYKSYVSNGGNHINGDFKFIGILPKESIIDSNKDFDPSDINIESLLKSVTSEYDVDALLPKFKVEDSNTLVEPLKSMGIKRAFIPDIESEFTNMAEGQDFCISEILQKVVVEVNEQGTEAAAATAVFMKNDSCAMPEFKETKVVHLNRPFMFLIYDAANDNILFAGKIKSLPNAE